MSTLGLEKVAGRCPQGYAPIQHPRFCLCPSYQASEWDLFVSALKSAAVDGVVSQRNVRPLIRGRIEPKHIGRNYQRAKREGLIVEVGHETSNDEQGKNAGRLEPRYELRAA